jgi:hypothetical protein
MTRYVNDKQPGRSRLWTGDRVVKALAIQQAIRAAMLVAAGLLLGACSQSVVVKTDFPEPLVEPLPLKVGLHYDPELTDYTYTEDLPSDATWSFTLGDVNTKLFDGAFNALFEQTIQVDDTGGTGDPYDGLNAVIEPKLEAFEFSLPRQSRSEQYSVWIRYRLNVYTPDGTLITGWPVSAYGQSDSRAFGKNAAMGQAAINALRDAFASIVIGFAKEPQIKAALLPESADDES